MKVLQINASCGYGSTGRNVLEIAKRLNEEGVNCHIAYCIGESYEKGYVIGNPTDWKFHALFSRLSGLQGYFSHGSTQKLIRYMKQNRFDVVHLNNLHSNYIHLEKLLSFLAKEEIATVVTLHDCFFYTGKCTHYTVEGCLRWQDSCESCPRKKKDNFSWFFDRSAKMLYDKKKWFSRIKKLAVVGVSKWITDEARKSILKDSFLLTTIYNWVDQSVFYPRDTQELKARLGLQDKFVILSVAIGWGEEKGLSDFLKLSEKLKEDEVIVLIGKVPVSTVLPSNIHCIAYVEYEQLAAYYSMADVYVSLSREESFGKVVAEALSCGTPAVVYDSTASPELVRDGCGFAVPPRDTEAVLACVSTMKEKGKHEYAQNCISFAKEHFDKDQNIEQYLAVYRKLLS